MNAPEAVGKKTEGMREQLHPLGGFMSESSTEQEASPGTYSDELLACFLSALVCSDEEKGSKKQGKK